MGGEVSGRASAPSRIRERAVTLAGLAAITLLAWRYIVHLATADAGAMAGHGMGDMHMPAMQPWHGADIALAFVMWSVMMVAMMTPAASPFVLTYSGLQRVSKGVRGVHSTAALLAGYLGVWLAFSAGATLLQFGFHSAGLLSGSMVGVAPAAGAVLLVAAGAYQFTPWKHACLAKCRSPLAFLMTEWRGGAGGALVMGARHGFYCLGCCWSLMLLLFVAGAMNLLWIAAIAVYVLIERSLPLGRWFSRTVGAVAIACGVWLTIAGG